jgi:hypothetical protein
MPRKAALIKARRAENKEGRNAPGAAVIRRQMPVSGVPLFIYDGYRFGRSAQFRVLAIVPLIAERHLDAQEGTPVEAVFTLRGD